MNEDDSEFILALDKQLTDAGMTFYDIPELLVLVREAKEETIKDE